MKQYLEDRIAELEKLKNSVENVEMILSCHAAIEENKKVLEHYNQQQKLSSDEFVKTVVKLTHGGNEKIKETDDFVAGIKAAYKFLEKVW